MKKLLLLLAIFLIKNISAQSDTILRLRSLKTMHDSSLIDDREYDQLKAKVLGIAPPAQKAKEPVKIDINALKRKYNSQCFAAFGFAAFCGFSIYKSVSEFNKIEEIQYDSKGNVDPYKSIKYAKAKKTNSEIFMASGIATGAIAIGIIINSQFTLYKIHKARALKLGISPSGFNLTYCFN